VTRFAIGRARFTSEVTQESEQLMFGVLHLGGHNLAGAVAKLGSEAQYRELAKTMRTAFGHSDLSEAIQLLGVGFGGQIYSLKDLFKDEQRKVAGEILKPILERVRSPQREIYEDEAPLLRFMRHCHLPIPKELNITAELALNDLLRVAIEDGPLDGERVQSLIEDVRTLGVPLDQSTLEITLRRNLERRAEALLEDFRNLDALRELRRSVAIAKSLPLPLVLWSLQNRCWEILHTVYPEMKDNDAREWIAELEELARLLGLRVQ
jgi:hypothetical protein